MQVEQGHHVEYRVDQGLERCPPQVRDDVGVPEVQADPHNRSEPIRVTRPRRAIGLADNSSGPGKTGARFSIAIVTLTRSARSARARQRARLEQQRVLARPARPAGAQAW